MRSRGLAGVVLLLACSSGTKLAIERHDGATIPAPDGPLAPADASAADAPVGADTALAADASAAEAPPVDLTPAPPDAAADLAPVHRDASADWAPCGHADEQCCPDLSCVDPETVCVGNDLATALCKRCGRSQGAAILPCCPGNRCLDGSCCVHLQTGNLGPFCIGVGVTCFDTNSRCAASGSCGPGCGAAGQPCCQALGTPYCSASGTACMRATGAAGQSCIACGQAGQPCCQQVASPYSIEPCGDGLRCQGDRCG